MFVADFLLGMGNIDIALVIIPGWNPVPPPDLPGNTPVLNISHPLEIGVFPIVRNKTDITVFNSCNGWFGQGLYFNVPLISQEGFNHAARAVSTWNHQFMRLYFFQQFLSFQISDDLLSGINPVHSDILIGN